MSLKKDFLFCDALNVSQPWNITSLAYLKCQSALHITIDYEDAELQCPLCGCEACISGKHSKAYKYYNFFGNDTFITVNLPLISSHNEKCRSNDDPFVIVNTMLLDLLLKQLSNRDKVFLFNCFFTARNDTTSTITQ